MKRMKLSGLVAALAVCLAPDVFGALGTTIGVSFQGRQNGAQDPTPALAPTEVAGVVAQTNWNNIDNAYNTNEVAPIFLGANKGTTGPLVDSNGVPTTVTLTFSANDSWYNDTDPTTITTGNAHLMNGLIKEQGAGTASTFTFNNLSDGQYDLYVYFDMNGDGVRVNFSAGIPTPTTFYVVETHQFNDGDPFVQCTNTNPAGPYDVGNYVRFPALATLGGSTLTLSATYVSGADGNGIAGFQLVNVGGPVGNTNPVSIVTQPISRRIATNSPASFSITSAGPAPQYQWFKVLGAVTNAIPNATNSSVLTAPVTDADNGSIFYCIVSNNVNSVQSSSAVLSVGHLLTVQGYCKQEMYFGAGRQEVENQTVGAPSFVKYPTFVDTPTGQGTGYSERISGLFTPDVAGNYVFFVCADDDTDVFLSSNSDPASKKLICHEPTWTNYRSWDGIVGGGRPSNDSSLSGDPGAGTITLAAGTAYYFEAVHHQGGGGDGFTLTFNRPLDATDPLPASGDASKMTGNLISALALDGVNLSITGQPADKNGYQGQTATFTVAATASYSGDTTITPAIVYQWQSQASGGASFSNIVGEVNASFTTPLLTLADNGSKYRCVLTVPGMTPGSTNSAAAALTVLVDNIPPTVLAAGTVSFDHVGVQFSELIDPTTGADATKYSVSGGTVSAAVVNYDGRSVTLTTTGLSGGAFTVGVNGVTDLAGNPVTTNVNAHIESGLINQDVDTAELGYATSTAAGEFYITAGGSDMWGNADQFHFVGKQETGDFDKRIRVETIEPVNRWTKAGLVVRENLDNTAGGGTGIGGAINLDIYVMPLAVQTQDDPNNPTGQNGIEAGFRGAPDGSTGGWPSTANGSQINPSHLPGAWVRLSGKGHTNYTAYWSTNGTDWILHSSATMNPPLTNQYVGIMQTAHDNNAGFTADVHYTQYGDVVVSVPPSVTITGTSITFTGTLQSTPSLNPTTWADVPSATSPYPLTPTGTKLFYRARQ